MSSFDRRGHRLALMLTVSGLALSSGALAATAAHADRGDRDGDAMPNQWEVRHGLGPDRADARGDRDRDGLSNLGELRRGGDPRDEDTDNDGHDDGDEVHDARPGTEIDDRDSDDDGTSDGDEDSDRDGVDNEDEDDARESCSGDDDDRDEDGLSDEDENDHGYRAGDDDSDDDGVVDGDEDSDDDGQDNEDDDDSDSDTCRDDTEDSDDLLGSIVSFDAATGQLVISSVHAGVVTFVVTEDTEIEYDSSGPGSGEDGSAADLVNGAVVTEVDVDDDTGALEEIELART